MAGGRPHARDDLAQRHRECLRDVSDATGSIRSRCWLGCGGGGSSSSRALNSLHFGAEGGNFGDNTLKFSSRLLLLLLLLILLLLLLLLLMLILLLLLQFFLLHLRHTILKRLRGSS
jgi:hypothetical protein